MEFVNPNTGNQLIPPGRKPFWRSKKFQSMVLGAIAVVIAEIFGMDADKIVSLIAPFVAYILGEAYVDAHK